MPIHKRKPSTIADVEDLCSTHSIFEGEEVHVIQESLLDWYDRNHRVLPWRHNNFSKLDSLNSLECQNKPVHENVEYAATDRQSRAYGIWVSEVMLQQTRVATVIEYYKRWMEKWPALPDLSKATIDEVNAMWAGLGYYRRARFLLEGAKYIIDHLDGLFPDSVVELQKIPGIGKYTAGAIASIAFEQPAPVVDGNVIRVLCRLRAITSNTKENATIKFIWGLAEQVVDPKRPGDFNQALMELGATLCSPMNPGCSTCPVASHCKALARESEQHKQLTKSAPAVSVTDFPRKTLKLVPREEYVAVCVVEMAVKTGSYFLLRKRPENGLLAGLWEFPSASLDGPGVTPKKQIKAVDLYLKSKVCIRIGKGGYAIKHRQLVGSYTHVFSHIRMHMSIEWMLLHSGQSKDGCCFDQVNSCIKWVDSGTMLNIGLTSGVKKVYKMVCDFKHATDKEAIKKKTRS